MKLITKKHRIIACCHGDKYIVQFSVATSVDMIKKGTKKMKS